MSDSDAKPKGRYEELPKMRTPSGRFVYDPGQAPTSDNDPEVVRRLLEGMRAIESADARDAIPPPVEAPRANDGAIVAAGEDAAKAHAEAVLEPHVVPRMPSAPLRIAEALDPRKQVTARMVRATAGPPPRAVGPQPATKAANDSEPAGDEGAPAASGADASAAARTEASTDRADASAAPPSSRPPPSVTENAPPAVDASWRRRAALLALVLGSAALAVVLGVTLLRPPAKPGDGPAPPGTAAISTSAPSTSAPAPPGTSVGETTSAPSASGAPSVPPTTSAEPAPSAPASQVPSTGPAVKPPKAAAPDPNGDAGTPPQPAATAEPSVPPAGSSAVPATTVAPSSKPAASSAPAAPKSTGDDDFYIRSSKKKETATP